MNVAISSVNRANPLVQASAATLLSTHEEGPSVIRFRLQEEAPVLLALIGQEATIRQDRDFLTVGNWYFETEPPLEQRSEQRSRTETELRELALFDPIELMAIASDKNRRPSELTFAAEALGCVQGFTEVDAILRSLVKHEAPLVREGAVYGIVHRGPSRFREVLREIAASDSSPGVRDAAYEVLGD